VFIVTPKPHSGKRLHVFVTDELVLWDDYVVLCVKTRGWVLELGDAIRGTGAPQVGLTFELRR
jgi:hypothetical protein